MVLKNFMVYYHFTILKLIKVMNCSHFQLIVFIELLIKKSLLRIFLENAQFHLQNAFSIVIMNAKSTVIE